MGMGANGADAMILGFHVVFGAYGFWLPNDPRGSWSDFVGSWVREDDLILEPLTFKGGFVPTPTAPGLGCEPFTEIVLSEHGNGALRADGRNTDTCGGDSGGPVFAMTHDINEQTGKIRVHNYLVAITSRGMNIGQPNKNLPCGGGGIYEVVSRRSVQDWLTRFGVRFRN